MYCNFASVRSVHMSSAHIALLGAVAGFTIYLGLPIGRLPTARPRLKTMLNAIATGILLFLLWDVLYHGWEPVDTALGHRQNGDALAKGAVLAAAFGCGLLGWSAGTGGAAERRGHRDLAGLRSVSWQPQLGPPPPVG
jgi:ZIP family zinc transporter